LTSRDYKRLGLSEAHDPSILDRDYSGRIFFIPNEYPKKIAGSGLI
jgi:hypothetical protein